MNIRATCPDCGDVVISRDDVHVRVCAEDRSGSYCFRCPMCSMGVSKQTEDRIVQLLVAGGVRMTVWHLPAELSEAREGPVISYDDVLDFHMALESDDWVSELSA